mgnify:CR=1 FL=1
MTKDQTVTNRRLERMTHAVNHRLLGLTIVAEGTHLRHNLSAMIRSAESFGVTNVHLISSEKRKMSGAAKGAERWVEMSIFDTTEQCFESLKDQGFQIFVADLQDDSYTPETIPIDRPVAIVMGTELVGVSDTAKSLADGSVMIPMYGLTQSLNVSVASACLLQRLSTRMREQGVGDLSDSDKEDLLQSWLDREANEKENRNNRRKLGQ